MKIAFNLTHEEVLMDIVAAIEEELIKLKEMIKLKECERQIMSQAIIVSQGLGYIESYMSAKEFNQVM